MVSNNNGLVPKLIKEQRRLKLRDEAFSSLLRISRSLWYQTKHGEKGIGVALLSGAYHAFPHLEKDILKFLKVANHEQT